MAPIRTDNTDEEKKEGKTTDARVIITRPRMGADEEGTKEKNHG
jgi:hypothetical protein